MESVHLEKQNRAATPTIRAATIRSNILESMHFLYWGKNHTSNNLFRALATWKEYAAINPTL